jgi:FHS family L-fucose permease-like MFS transporter
MKSLPNKTNITSMIIMGALFFIFGFVTWLNGTLIPYLKIACELNTFQSLLVAFAFYIAYFVMALPASWVLQKTGFKKGMSLGLLIMALGALIFIPAAQTRTYFLFLSGLFIIGMGLSVLQTAVNPFVTILGPIESAAKRISIMGICSKLAGVMAPFILGAIILSDADTLIHDLKILDAAHKNILLNELSSRVIFPYTIMAVVLLCLAGLVLLSPLPEIEAEEDVLEDSSLDIKSHVLHFPNLVFGVVALFLYVGVEVIAGDTIGTYGQSQGIPLSQAKNFTSLTLIAMVLGYIIGIAVIPKIITQSKALAISAMTGIVFSLCAILANGFTSVVFIALLGLSNALMWPAIWPLAIHKLGKYTKTGAALLIMALAGGATLPLIYGALADQVFIGPKNAYWVLVPSYLFILFYSVKGHKIKKW